MAQAARSPAASASADSATAVGSVTPAAEPPSSAARGRLARWTPEGRGSTPIGAERSIERSVSFAELQCYFVAGIISSTIDASLWTQADFLRIRHFGSVRRILTRAPHSRKRKRGTKRYHVSSPELYRPSKMNASGGARTNHLSGHRAAVLAMLIDHGAVDHGVFDTLRRHHQPPSTAGQIVLHLRALGGIDGIVIE